MGTAIGFMGHLTELQQLTAGTYTYLVDEQGLSPEEAMAALNDPDVQAIQSDMEQLQQELEAIDHRAAQALTQRQELARATQQPIVESDKSTRAKVKPEAKRQPAKVTANTKSSQSEVESSISDHDAERFMNRLAYEALMPEAAQRELVASLQQERLTLIDSYEHKINANA